MIPVVAMTAHVMPEERDQIMQAGMDDYLAKPFRREELIQMVETWTNSRAVPKADPTDTVKQGAPDNAVIFDKSIADKLAEDTGDHILPALVDTFVTNTKERCETIKVAIEAADLKTLRAEAHAIKSSAASFGAMALHHMAEGLETAARQDDAKAAVQLAKQMSSCGHDATTAIEDWLASRGTHLNA